MAVINLEVLTDINGVDKEGNPKVVKQDVAYNKQFDTNDMLVENFINPRGRVVKKYCIVKSSNEYFKLNHKYEEIIKLTQTIKFKGFEFKKKK